MEILTTTKEDKGDKQNVSVILNTHLNIQFLKIFIEYLLKYHHNQKGKTFDGSYFFFVVVLY